jgi:hypothetical protein
VAQTLAVLALRGHRGLGSSSSISLEDTFTFIASPLNLNSKSQVMRRCSGFAMRCDSGFDLGSYNVVVVFICGNNNCMIGIYTSQCVQVEAVSRWLLQWVYRTHLNRQNKHPHHTNTTTTGLFSSNFYPISVRFLKHSAQVLQRAARDVQQHR